MIQIRLFALLRSLTGLLANGGAAFALGFVLIYGF